MAASRGAGATFEVAADAYDRHIGRYGSSLAAELLRIVAPERGQRALDVGCGPGALTTALAAILGPDRVAAVDPSEAFARACRVRVPGADVRDAAAEALPFGDAEFDLVLSQLVVNFFADAPAGVREMRRVTRPGGVVGACVWDYAGGMTLLRRFWDAARRVDPDGAPARDEGSIMHPRTASELADLWHGAGLREVETGELPAGASYASFDALWEPFELGAGPSGSYVAALDRTRRAALRDELRRALGRPEGQFTLAARAWWVTGRTPA